MSDGRATSNRVRKRTARATLDNNDFNVLLGALDCEDEYIRDYEGAQDPYRLEIQKVVEKLQAARGRMR